MLLACSALLLGPASICQSLVKKEGFSKPLPCSMVVVGIVRRLAGASAIGVVVLACTAACQSFPILLPPATPTSTDMAVGPPPPVSNLTAQPLPAPPQPALGTQQFTIQLVPPDPSVYQSIPVPANFLGISLELSVADDYLGQEIGEPNYQFLNYLNNIRVRAGVGPVLRIGGASCLSALPSILLLPLLLLPLLLDSSP